MFTSARRRGHHQTESSNSGTVEVPVTTDDSLSSSPSSLENDISFFHFHKNRLLKGRRRAQTRRPTGSRFIFISVLLRALLLLLCFRFVILPLARRGGQRPSFEFVEFHPDGLDARIANQPPEKKPDIYYSACLIDRSGSVILDMLYANAYSYQNNGIYGGGCFTTFMMPMLAALEYHLDPESQLNVSEVDIDGVTLEEQLMHYPVTADGSMNVASIMTHMLKRVDDAPAWAEHLLKKRVQHETLIRAVGHLDRVLGFACPKFEIDMEAFARRDKNIVGGGFQPIGGIVPSGVYNCTKPYFSHDGLFTPDWLEYIHSSILGTPEERQLLREEANNGVYNIALHVRRGDIEPCNVKTNKYSKRYLPNSHYIRVLNELVFTKETMEEALEASGRSKLILNMTIFSESDSFESFDIFQQSSNIPNLFPICQDTDTYECILTVALDSDVPSIWYTLAIQADVIVLSRSTFSLVPAILNVKGTLSNYPAKVIYTRFEYPPLPGWIVLETNETFLQQTERENEELRRTQCDDDLTYSKYRKPVLH